MPVYPNSIKQFTTKRDNIDIDYASDINALQDEVRAIEMALGINPMTATLNTGTVSYADVATRLNALETGENSLLNGTVHPTARVTGTYMVATARAGTQASLSSVAWDNQGSQADGIGVTAQRTGYYLISASGRWEVPSPVQGNSMQFLSIRLGSTNEVVGGAGYLVSYTGFSGAPGAVRIDCSDIVHLTSGTTLRWWAFNTATYSIGVVNMSLTTWFLSEG